MNLPRPMKATPIERTPDLETDYASTTFVVEPKVDGVRAYLVVGDGRTRIFMATSGTEITHDLPQLHGLEKAFGELFLDGELVIPGEALGPLVGALNASKRRPILDRAVFYAFDILTFRGKKADGRYCLKDESLKKRRQVLEGVAEFFPTGVRIINQYPAAQVFVDAIQKAGFEGYMLKDQGTLYEEGRSHRWKKFKWTSTIDCFVTGWEPGQGSNEGLVGSLILSVYGHDDSEIEVGKHGVFPDDFRASITAADGSLRPEVYGQVHEVTYQSVGTDMRLRHPRLLRVRPDKIPAECSIDQLTEGRHPCPA